MNKNDLKRFTKCTIGTLANSNAIATDSLLDLWFEAAKDDGITIEQWEAAAKKIIRGRKYTSQPTYADFYETIFGSPVTEADQANNQAAHVLKQIRELGSYNTPSFEDPVTKKLMASRWSWQSVCAMTEAELKWWAKEFIEAYQSAGKIDKQAMIESKSEKLKMLASGIGKQIT